MQFIFAVQGSQGDINPCIAIALGLRERGHRVLFVTTEYYGPLLGQFGIEFVSILSRDDHLRIRSHPDLNHRFRSFRFTGRELLLGLMRQEYTAIRERYQPGETLVLALGVTFGARIAHDSLHVPFAMLVPFPEWMRSVLQEHGAPRRRELRVAIRRFLHSVLNWRMTSLLAPGLNQFRRELGLPLIDKDLARWIYPPELILGMFPEWYAGYQPDWPPNVYLTGFPMFDGGEATELAPEVEEFLSAGAPPVVFNALSAFQNAREFFDIGVAVVRRMNRRAILLSQFPQNIPPEVPAEVAHFRYVPHSLLLPRAAAIVHQGGIGTTAKALRAGIPQIIVPLNFDQPFNGRRVTSMGVGATLAARECRPERLAKELEALLGAPLVARKLEDYSARVRHEDGTQEACRVLEEVLIHGRHPSRASGV